MVLHVMPAWGARTNVCKAKHLTRLKSRFLFAQNAFQQLKARKWSVIPYYTLVRAPNAAIKLSFVLAWRSEM
jgi:hypothetical protein